jgi:hypothetical protein
MKEIQVAIEQVTADSFRCFYIAEDDPSQAMRLLRAAFPNVGRDVRLYPPLNEAAGNALHMQPGEVLEWRIGERIIASSLIDPLEKQTG